jgi:exo-beta-1,3-glucanase (GH17 family)
LILGVFISQAQGGVSGAQSQVTEILAWAQWDLVELIVIGNEAVSQGACTASELAGFMSSCKSSFQSKGYKGLITTTDTLDIWQENFGIWCDVIDVTGVNLHAFFNADTVAKDAGTLIKAQLELADNLCPGKYAVNLETGWPTSASGCNGQACAGISEQSAAIASIQAEVGGISVLFSYTDDAWKDPGFLSCERSWGLKDFFN